MSIQTSYSWGGRTIYDRVKTWSSVLADQIKRVELAGSDMDQQAMQSSLQQGLERDSLPSNTWFTSRINYRSSAAGIFASLTGNFKDLYPAVKQEGRAELENTPYFLGYHELSASITMRLV